MTFIADTEEESNLEEDHVLMEFRGQDQENNYSPPSATKDPSARLPSASTPMVSSLAERRDHHNHHNDHHLNQIDGADLTPDLAPPAPTGIGLVSRSPPPPASTPITTTTTTTTAAAAATKSKVTYRECLKNHAANIGGHVVDGCGEFMPSGQDGTQESMKCAACECHRNFHRKEIDGETQQQQKYLLPSNSFSTTHHLYKNNNTLLPLPLPPQPPPLHHHHHNNHQQQQLPAPHNQHHRHGYRGSMIMNFGGGGGGGAGEESSSEDLNGYESNNNFIQGQASVLQPSSMRKRFRTKFSQEQKEKMMEFADKLDWKMQKQDDQEVLQFCSQLGIKRKVFKVWMHNNKQASKKKPM